MSQKPQKNVTDFLRYISQTPQTFVTDTLNTCHRHPRNLSQTPRHKSQTSQTLVTDILGTCHRHPRHLSQTSQLHVTDTPKTCHSHPRHMLQTPRHMSQTPQTNVTDTRNTCHRHSWIDFGEIYIYIFLKFTRRSTLSTIWSKNISFGQNNPKRLYGWDKLQFSIVSGSFLGLFDISVANIGFQMCSYIPRLLLECDSQLKLSSIGQKPISFGQKQPQNKYKKKRKNII